MRLGMALGKSLGQPLAVKAEVSELFAAVLALAAGRPVFTADYFIPDPVSGKVLAFVDWNDPTHRLVQATAANQVALPAPHSDFARQLCVSFTGAEYYVGNRATSTMPYTFDGTGAELALAIQSATGGTKIWLGDRTSNQNGFSVFVSATTISTTVTKPSATVGSPAAFTVPATAFVYQFRHGTAENPDMAHKITGQAEVSSDYTGAPPGSGSAQTALALGGTTAAGALTTGRFRSLVMSPVLTAAQRAQRDKWLLQDTGIAA